MVDFSQTSSNSDIILSAEPVARRIGLIALATDHTTERDFARLCDPDEVGVYVNRIAYANPTTPENLRRTGPLLAEAAAEILPDERLDVLAYGCTAASVVLGDEAVAHHLRTGKPDVSCVTPTSAAFAAFRALGVTRISLLTPYSQEVTQKLETYFAANGFDIVSYTALGFDDDRQMARIAPESIIARGREAIDDTAEALFISCTALRSLVCVDALEAQTGRPIVTSNQALIWRSLRLAGIDRSIPGYGRLFTV